MTDQDRDKDPIRPPGADGGGERPPGHGAGPPPAPRADHGPVRPSGGGRSAVWAIVILLLVGVVGLGFLVVLGLVAAAGMGADSGDRVRERTVRTGGDKKIVLFHVEGIISNIRGIGLLGGMDDTVALVRDNLERAADDDRVAAVIMRVNSPGGGVTASDQVHKLIADFREDTGKPVVVLMDDIAASGGYYIAAPADHIVVHPTTITGSVGVIMSTWNVSEFADEHGIGTTVVKSGPYKDILSPWRPTTDEEQAILQDLVDQMYERFLEVIMSGREMTREDLEPWARGQVWSGPDAVDAGLADEVGYMEDAVARARKLAKAPDARVVEFQRYVTLGDLFGAQVRKAAGPDTVRVELPGAAGRLLEDMDQGPRLHYLWDPR